MFSFNNTHIFTGYLKQLLSSFNLPTCKVYTNEFAKYFETHYKEDPRIIRSFNTLLSKNENGSIVNCRLPMKINYLKGDSIYSLVFDPERNTTSWQHNNAIFFDKDRAVPGLTRKLSSPGTVYDTKTHEYLGDFLRFIRDYYDVNLMPLYNCFNNKLYTNIYLSNLSMKNVIFDSSDSKYKIYAFPVKLFSDYTIAIECDQSIEMFCSFYKTSLDASKKAIDLINRTYQKVNGTSFNQPFLYDKLDVKYWPDENKATLMLDNVISRCDIANKEQDLKLFIKVPSSCNSTITVLEGDYRRFNDFMYQPRVVTDGQNRREVWDYKINRNIINFEAEESLNDTDFKPICKLQLLAFNTNESYPFSDRLVEYLSGSVITTTEGISDNIRRVQKVMNQNKHYFKIPGVWENKIQKITYDYMMNSGRLELVDTSKLKTLECTGPNGGTEEYYSYSLEADTAHKENCLIKKTAKTADRKILVDKRKEKRTRRGYTNKSTIYDVLGYVDRDVEKYYASWKKEDNKDTIAVVDSLQNVDIYNGLFDE